MRPATRADSRAICALLARAFVDDPLIAWMLPDPAKREAQLGRFFRMMVDRVHLPHGGCEIVGRPDAAALWDPPGQWRSTTAARILSAPTLARLFGRRLPGITSGLAEIDAIHPMPLHWYLATIGTDPAAQGRGLGAALIESGLARSDAQHLPAYLEASTARNVAYYERFGFEVTKEVHVPDGPPLWLMWRPAPER